MKNITLLVAVTLTSITMISPHALLAVPTAAPTTSSATTPAASNVSHGQAATGTAQAPLNKAHAALQNPAALPPTVRPEYDHGPRAGFMRGTKDVQSELLLGPGSGIRLYFVDHSWIDVPLKDTSLKVALSKKSAPAEKTDLACTLGADSYSCALPKSLAFTLGDSLEVKFSRIGDPATEYTFHYTFPFQASER